MTRQLAFPFPRRRRRKTTPHRRHMADLLRFYRAQGKTLAEACIIMARVRRTLAAYAKANRIKFSDYRPRKG